MTDAIPSWTICSLSRRELKQLSRRSDRAGLIHYGAFFALLIALGTATVLTWGTLWVVPAFFLYATVYGFAGSRLHECHHGTPFRTHALNEVLHQLFGIMAIKEAVRDRWMHTQHHTYTYFTARDPEIQSKRPPDLLYMAVDIFRIPNSTRFFWLALRNATGKLDPEARAIAPADVHGQIVAGVKPRAGILYLRAAGCHVVGSARGGESHSAGEEDARALGAAWLPPPPATEAPEAGPLQGIDRWKDRTVHCKQRHTAKRIFERLRDHGCKPASRITSGNGAVASVDVRAAAGHAHRLWRGGAIIAGKRRAHFFATQRCRRPTRPATEAWLDGRGLRLLRRHPQSILATMNGTRTRAFMSIPDLFQDRYGRPGKGNDKGKVEGLASSPMRVNTWNYHIDRHHMWNPMRQGGHAGRRFHALSPGAAGGQRHHRPAPTLLRKLPPALSGAGRFAALAGWKLRTPLRRLLVLQVLRPRCGSRSSTWCCVASPASRTFILGCAGPGPVAVPAAERRRRCCRITEGPRPRGVRQAGTKCASEGADQHRIRRPWN